MLVSVATTLEVLRIQRQMSAKNSSVHSPLLLIDRIGSTNRTRKTVICARFRKMKVTNKSAEDHFRPANRDTSYVIHSTMLAYKPSVSIHLFESTLHVGAEDLEFLRAKNLICKHNHSPFH